MKRLFFLAAICSITFFTACEQTEMITDNTLKTVNLQDRADAVYTLYAGQDIEAGTVTVTSTDTDLVVTYETNDCWSLGTTHLYAGTAEDLPMTGAGNPKHGQFPYAQEVEEDSLGNPVELLDVVIFTIPLSEIEMTEQAMEGVSAELSCLYVAAHAELYNDCFVPETSEEVEEDEDEVETGDEEETGYAAWDTEFDGNRWGGLIEYCM